MFLLTFTLLFNCSLAKKPEFIKLDNIKVIDSNSKNITLSVDALFLNKNDVGGTLRTDDIKLIINNSEVAHIIADEFDVPRKKNFTIPLTVSVSTDRLLNKNSLSGLLSSLISQQLKVRYKGEIKYQLLGFSSRYSLDEIQDVKIKL